MHFWIGRKSGGLWWAGYKAAIGEGVHTSKPVFYTELGDILFVKMLTHPKMQLLISGSTGKIGFNSVWLAQKWEKRETFLNGETF